MTKRQLYWLAFRVGLPIVACPLAIVAGRYVGKYIFPVGPPCVRGTLDDNMLWGGVYGGLGAFIGALIIGKYIFPVGPPYVRGTQGDNILWGGVYGDLRAFIGALIISLAGGVVSAFFLLTKCVE